MLPTGLLGGETSFELSQVPRVVFHSTAILHLVVRESRAYPHSRAIPASEGQLVGQVLLVAEEGRGETQYCFAMLRNRRFRISSRSMSARRLLLQTEQVCGISPVARAFRNRGYHMTCPGPSCVRVLFLKYDLHKPATQVTPPTAQNDVIKGSLALSRVADINRRRSASLAKPTHVGLIEGMAAHAGRDRLLPLSQPLVVLRPR